MRIYLVGLPVFTVELSQYEALSADVRHKDRHLENIEASPKETPGILALKIDLLQRSCRLRLKMKNCQVWPMCGNEEERRKLVSVRLQAWNELVRIGHATTGGFLRHVARLPSLWVIPAGGSFTRFMCCSRDGVTIATVPDGSRGKTLQSYCAALLFVVIEFF